MKWVWCEWNEFFWCLHALLWHRRYIIQMHFNIHCCELGKGFMSAVCVCTLHTAWQLVPYITASQPHTHIQAHTHTHTQVHAHAFKHSKMQRERNLNCAFTNRWKQTYEWQTLDVFFLRCGYVCVKLPHAIIPLSCVFYSFNPTLCILCLGGWPPAIYKCSLLYVYIYWHILLFMNLHFSHLDVSVLSDLCSKAWGDEVLEFLSTNIIAHPLQTSIKPESGKCRHRSHLCPKPIINITSSVCVCA